MNPINQVSLFFLIYAILFLVGQSSVIAAKHSSIRVEDQALQACLDSLALKHSWSTAKEFQNITCNSRGVRSLRGLEQFTDITTLSVYNNRLSTIDVDLSVFKKLKTLNVARNRLAETKLQSLFELEAFYVFGNQLKSITLHELPKLKIVKAHNNFLLHFVYSSTPLLGKIYIFNNQLKNIDIDHLPSLRYMDCRQNPMPDELYDKMDAVDNVNFLHDGNADDW
jgi:Leucine-rich repeat (LRR) protein